MRAIALIGSALERASAVTDGYKTEKGPPAGLAREAFCPSVRVHRQEYISRFRSANASTACRMRRARPAPISGIPEVIWASSKSDSSVCPASVPLSSMAGLVAASKPGDPAHLSLSEAPTTTIMARETLPVALELMSEQRSLLRSVSFSGVHRRRSAMRPAERVKIIDGLQLSQQSFS